MIFMVHKKIKGKVCPRCGSAMKKTLADTWFCYTCKKEIHPFDEEAE